ncbi:hypothetical protein L4D00_00525 [Photobacterium swingsii]|uniref:Uncharacterized protein n=1 Tax=Photobacterium swingsii TaxID=680026 RepID=A0A0J8VDH8_9GAMM|nr:hypothetical protein [Photobacterium swingsii]KMV30580.1 hypothetical protein AB733_11535 [Photobacterium swingsii]PSW23854.1 hypothetical protein C9I94_14255 [Photobacterium swingsii]
MDIERFSPYNTNTPPPSVIAPLPTTVEMTGFSGQRHFLEQHISLANTPQRQEGSQWSPPLESLY